MFSDTDNEEDNQSSSSQNGLPIILFVISILAFIAIGGGLAFAFAKISMARRKANTSANQVKNSFDCSMSECGNCNKNSNSEATVVSTSFGSCSTSRPFTYNPIYFNRIDIEENTGSNCTDNPLFSASFVDGDHDSNDNDSTNALHRSSSTRRKYAQPMCGKISNSSADDSDNGPDYQRQNRSIVEVESDLANRHSTQLPRSHSHRSRLSSQKLRQAPQSNHCIHIRNKFPGCDNMENDMHVEDQQSVFTPNIFQQRRNLFQKDELQQSLNSSLPSPPPPPPPPAPPRYNDKDGRTKNFNIIGVLRRQQSHDEVTNIPVREMPAISFPSTSDPLKPEVLIPFSAIETSTNFLENKSYKTERNQRLIMNEVEEKQLSPKSREVDDTRKSNYFRDQMNQILPEFLRIGSRLNDTDKGISSIKKAKDNGEERHCHFPTGAQGYLPKVRFTITDQPQPS